MRTFEGRIVEMQLDPAALALPAEAAPPPPGLLARIACPPGAIPAAGQAVLAWAPEDADAPLAATIFPARVYPGAGEGEAPGSAPGFLAAPPVPPLWQPGTRLRLRGPLGRGFSPPAAARRLALAALGPPGNGPATAGPTAHRLLALAHAALDRGCDVALFTAGPLPPLPAAVTIDPPAALPEALAWADYLALDLPLESLPGLRAALGLPAGARLPLPAQTLLTVPMPCGGLAECGACAVAVGPTPAQRAFKLACKDGPVFDLADLEW